MKEIRKTLGKNGAKLVRRIAVEASGTASILGYCQPKEPQILKKSKK